MTTVFIALAVVAYIVALVFWGRKSLRESAENHANWIEQMHRAIEQEAAEKRARAERAREREKELIRENVRIAWETLQELEAQKQGKES